MKRNTIYLLICIFVLAACSSAHAAWRTVYDGSVFPDSPALGSAAWTAGPTNDLSASSARDGMLHLVDQWADRSVWFQQGLSDYPAGSPVTVEARLRVNAAYSSADWIAPVQFGFSHGYSNPFIGFWTDGLATRYARENLLRFQPMDMTVFHTVRIAVEAKPKYSPPKFWVWVDGRQVFHGECAGWKQLGVYFGSSTILNDSTCDVDWDYVRYSWDFQPVPEPSSLAALGGGVMGLLALRRRRR